MLLHNDSCQRKVTGFNIYSLLVLLRARCFHTEGLGYSLLSLPKKEMGHLSYGERCTAVWLMHDQHIFGRSPLDDVFGIAK